LYAVVHHMHRSALPTRRSSDLAGNGAFEPRRLNIPECARFETTNLHYFVDDMSKYQEQHVVILGGGDSAVDWALMLEQVDLDIRSEEHTSELQSRFDLVCRLLL